MSFRIEEKIPVSRSDMMTIHADLVTRGLTRLHPARRIQSLYFETRDYAMFQNGEEGVLPRKKIRIRHYPDEESSPKSLEKKISSIEGRFKSSEKISDEQYKFFVENGQFDSLYGMCYPFLDVIYKREYWSLEGVRITFDTDILYRDADIEFSYPDRWCVIEIKAVAATNTDYLGKLLAIPRRRFSKFSNGMILLIQKQHDMWNAGRLDIS